jgi:phosphohistidine phosphatase
LHLYLVHHGEAAGPDVDIRRPLTERGVAASTALAVEAASRHARPEVIWHSGKLRARQTAEIFWRACNPLASMAASRDLQPDDDPTWVRDRLRFEPRDTALVGHFPHLPRLWGMLTGQLEQAGTFPLHGIVALETGDEGQTWVETWRLAPQIE